MKKTISFLIALVLAAGFSMTASADEASLGGDGANVL